MSKSVIVIPADKGKYGAPMGRSNAIPYDIERRGGVTMKTELSNVSCKYGAPMGRSNAIPDDIETAGKLYLEKLKWVDWDYDRGGAYWGQTEGDNIYRASGESTTEQIEIFVRASNRDQAKDLVREKCKDAKFYR